MGGNSVRVLTIASQKGGTGKTTTVINLAAAMAEEKRRVLVMDLDPQVSASHWLGVTDSGPEILELFTRGGDPLELVRSTTIEGVEVIPSSTYLLALDAQLNKRRKSQNEAITNYQADIKNLPRNRWDYILIDTPPSFGTLPLAALAVGGEVLIPIEAKIMALQGLALIMQTIETVKREYNNGLKISGVVACRVDTRTRHAWEVIDLMRETYGDKVLQTIIRENVRTAEAPSFAKPVTQYANKSTGAEDYRSLAREVIGQER